LVSSSPTPEIEVSPATDTGGVFELAAGFRIREEDSGVLLFEAKTLNTFVLNEGAAWALRMCLAGMSTAQVEEHSSSFLEDSRAPADVRELIGTLYALGALQRVSGANAKTPRSVDMQGPLSRKHTPLPHLRAPNTVWWDVTNRCNLDCLHCYSASSPRADNSDELTTREATDLITELAALGVFGIYFLGGEPLVRRDIFELIAHARAQGLGVTISSNGWRIDARVARRLSTLGVSQVRISLDGATPATHDWQRQRRGSFDRAINAVTHLRTAEVTHVGTVSTLTRHNVHQASDIIDLSYARGAHAIQILVVAQSGRGTDNYDTMSVSGGQAAALRAILRAKRDEYAGRMSVYSNDGLLPSKASEAISNGQVVPDFMGCQATRTCCDIDYNGDVIPCLLVRKPAAGNIRETPFRDIWQSSATFEAWRRQGAEHAECRHCRLGKICNRECPLSASQQMVTSAARLRTMSTPVMTDLSY
jgi:radical SAM protein with 4Fe4S-binding SPASM domain